jgi:hypothetical protein
MTIEELDFPEIVLDLPPSGLFMAQQYKGGVVELLQKILSPKFFSPYMEKKEKITKIKSFFNEDIPIVKWSDISDDSTNLSITLLCRHKVHMKNFFYDIISRWLIPNKRLNIDLFFVADFKLPEIEEKQTFSVAEAVINIRNKENLEEIKRNIRTIETEIRLGVVSDYHANKILEFKGLSSDKKTAMIQDKIGSLIRSRSKDFGQGIVSDMQFFLVTCRDEFKINRDYHHISRIISVLYIVRKLLKQKIKTKPHQRHLMVKFLKTYIQDGGKKKAVLGVLVGLNFLKENEFCGKQHLVRAINNFIPGVSAIDDSFFLDRKVKDAMQMLYLEVEKDNGGVFSLDEINKLRSCLSDYLKNNIEQLIHPIFMPRNEEEVVKNIVTLSHQLKYVQDLPQVIISFDKQTANELSFTVILLRVLKANDIPVQEIFNDVPTKYKFVFERVKKVGIVRRKYIKEANVFRVFIPSQEFLRMDNSVDLNKGRQSVLEAMQKIFGEVRDYNGGMIYKQNQVFTELKKSLDKIGTQNELLLEKFFYSITPVEMTVVRGYEPLKSLFLLLLNIIQKETSRQKKLCDYQVRNGDQAVFLVLPLKDVSKKRKINDAVEKLGYSSFDILSFYHHSLETSYIGYVFFSDNKEEQNDFVKSVVKSS